MKNVVIGCRDVGLGFRIEETASRYFAENWVCQIIQELSHLASRAELITPKLSLILPFAGFGCLILFLMWLMW